MLVTNVQCPRNSQASSSKGFAVLAEILMHNCAQPELMVSTIVHGGHTSRRSQDHIMLQVAVDMVGRVERARGFPRELGASLREWLQFRNCDPGEAAALKPRGLGETHCREAEQAFKARNIGIP
jgi:hypothetical protein